MRRACHRSTAAGSGWRRACCLTTAAFAAALGFAAAGESPFPLFFESPAVFQHAIAGAEKSVIPLDQRVTGLTVPHHLLAADLIADTLRLAGKNTYDRILLLSPDHFRRGKSAASTTLRPFQTPLGPVAVDRAATVSLLDSELFSKSDLFSHEHGVQAILPFLVRWFPGTPVVPVALDIRSRPADWAAIAAHLRRVVTPRTLVLQSTDFSHYLPQAVAATKDQQTLIALATGKPDAIVPLHQPNHLDSKAAQWIQLALQRDVFHCQAPVVVNNRNAIRYGGRQNEPRTTSYITQLFSPQRVPATSLPGQAWFFGGDTHFGRHVATALADPERADRIRRTILDVTGGRPLVVNLEGVVLTEIPSAVQPPLRIAMEAATTIRELQSLHVAAVVVANNHSLDFGPAARAEMTRILRDNHLTVIDAGTPASLGPFRLAAATDVVNLPTPARNVLTADHFAAWNQPANRQPLFAFLHCGTEYADSPGPRESQLADWAEAAGASLVIGCHPHRPSPAWQATTNSLRFPSLGNLIFDQTDPKNSGGLVEVRFFEQGTWSARWLPLGNLFATPSSQPKCYEKEKS